MRILTRDQVREVDRRAIEDWGMSGLVLMENAGCGATELILKHFAAASERQQAFTATICCGAGNNGGDGFVIARHLQIAGWEPKILLFAPPEKLQGDAEANHRIAQQAGIPINVFHREMFDQANDGESQIERLMQGADCVVDALLGTGASGDPRSPYDAAIRGINDARESGSWVVAVDLPSGLDCQTGQAGKPTVHADATATFVAAKPGLASADAKQFVGELSVVSIGVPPKLIDDVAGAH